jgi:dCTP deaminase
MILSHSDLKQYILYGGLEFTPSLSEDQFQQNGVDLILDSVEHNIICPTVFPHYTLGCTRETIKMPNDLMAFVQLRSTWARRGIILPPTIIDAGFQGQITLEIGSFCTVTLPIGDRFAHLIFAKLTTPTKPYNGKYQYQTGITGSR